jgi:zinc protease
MKPYQIIAALSLGLLFMHNCTPTKISEERLVLLPVPSDPTISFRIYFKTGSVDDPAGKEGLAYLTAQMLTEASTTKDSYEAIIAKLFPLAAGYEVTVSPEMTVISGRVHKDNLAEYYPLLINAILHPAFKEEDLNRIKSNVLNYLENELRYANDEELGKAVLYTEIFRGTGYGHLPEGTISSIKSITIGDIKKFYRQKFNRANFILGLAGAYDEELVQRLSRDLNRLPNGKPNNIRKVTPYDLDGLNVTIVEKNANATAISFGFPISITRGQPDWYALALANSWFGEHRNSSSHLYQVIREARGLNYGDYSYLEHFPYGGRLQFPPVNVCRQQQIFEVWIRPVPNPTRHFVLRAALRELQMLVNNGLTDEQCELTRNFLRKYILHFAPTTTMRLGYAIDDKFYQVPGSHLEIFRNRMDSLTCEEVNQALKKYLQYQNMQIVIVTNDAATLKEALVNDQPSPITYSTPKPSSVLEEDKSIYNYPLNIKPDKVKIVKVEELFQ